MSEEITPYQVVPKTPLAGSAAAEIREQGEITRRAFPWVLTGAWVMLTAALGGLFAVVEGYPDLKANQRYAQLQLDLADTENKVAYARNYYNGAVELYNTRVQTFPAVLLAGPLGFKPAEFFTADAASAAVPRC